MTVEYLIFNSRRTTYKAKKLLKALHQSGVARGLDIHISEHYKPCKTLMLYGLGGADRYGVAMEHIKSGGTLVSFDIGYWDRSLSNRKYRVSINGFHPKNILDIENESSRRFFQSGLNIATAKPNDGPIMLVGNAPKSIAVGAKNWTAAKSKELRRFFPYKKIIYRPKPKRPIESGVVYDVLSKGPIIDELKKCSLVVTRHSNVAIDACLLGVPVVCDDGAAACIYPQLLTDYENQPTIDKRKTFLYKLAYWQWSIKEVDDFWQWFLTNHRG